MDSEPRVETLGVARDGKLPFSLGFKGLGFKGQGSRVWGLGYKG